MHTEGRQDKDLIRFERIQLVIHAHIFTAVKVDIKLVVIMTVILGYLHMFVKTVTRFVSLSSLLHRHKGCAEIIGFQ